MNKTPTWVSVILLALTAAFIVWFLFEVYVSAGGQ